MGRPIPALAMVYAGMSQNPPEKPGKPVRKPLTQAEQRERRLAEALRANLRRRKAAGAGSGGPPSRRPQEGGE